MGTSNPLVHCGADVQSGGDEHGGHAVQEGGQQGFDSLQVKTVIIPFINPLVYVELVTLAHIG